MRWAPDGDKQKATLFTSSLLAELRTLTDRIAAAEAGEDARALKKLRLGPKQSPPS